MRAHSILFKLVLVLVVTLMAASCAPKPPVQTALMKESGVEDVTARELQYIVYATAKGAAGTIELAAQQIYDQTASPEVRQNSILWKLNAVPVIYQASFVPDPLGAFTNYWVFVVQMREYFTTGAGKALFGDLQPIAIDASHDLEAQAREIARSVMTEENAEQYREDVEVYASENPIENQLFVRTGNAHEFLKNIAGVSPGGLAAAAALNEEMRTLNDRMVLLTASIPRQVQWQTQLMMAQASEFVSAERESTMTSVQKESAGMLEPLMDFAAQQREIITTDVGEERAAMFADLAEERIAVLKALSEERSALLEWMDSERNAALESMNELTQASIDRLAEQSEEMSAAVIDRVFWRTLQLMALPFVAVLILCVVVLAMIRNWARRYLEVLEAAQRRTSPLDRESER